MPLRMLCVTARPEVAEGLARQIVSERLAACANLLPGVSSHYWWKGKLDSARETLILFKTQAKLVPKALKRIKALHPYEVPEIIALPITAAHAPYAAWVRAETRLPGTIGRKRCARP